MASLLSTRPSFRHRALSTEHEDAETLAAIPITSCAHVLVEHKSMSSLYDFQTEA